MGISVEGMTEINVSCASADSSHRHVGPLRRPCSSGHDQHYRFCYAGAIQLTSTAAGIVLPLIPVRPASSQHGQERELGVPQGFLVGRRKRRLPD